jgi:NADH-quinone oxidoreductase subunit D
MMLANRHDWVSAFSSELSIALVLEDAMGILTPERATWSRLLLAEMNRVTAGLIMLGASAPNFSHLLTHREVFLELLEQLTGSRIHPMFNRIGGIATACDPQWLDCLLSTSEGVQHALADLPRQILQEFAPLTGVGVITSEEINTYGLSGTLAWAAGVNNDLRVTAPYLAYQDVHTLVPATRNLSDIPTRFVLIAEQILARLTIMDAAIEWLKSEGAGPTSVQLPKVVRAPELTTYGAIEGPLGTMGVLLDSVGEKTPWRLKLRTPSFATIQSFESILVGLPLTALVPMLKSCAFMVGDADR